MERIEILRDMHQRGIPLAQIGEALGGMRVDTVSRLAIQNGLRRKPTITPEQREQIRDLSEDLPVRQIAKKVGCSRSQAGHWVIFWREREAKKRGELSTRQSLNRSKRCPIHGRLTLWPCVACAAENARRKPAPNPDDGNTVGKMLD